MTLLLFMHIKKRRKVKTCGLMPLKLGGVATIHALMQVAYMLEEISGM